MPKIYNLIRTVLTVFILALLLGSCMKDKLSKTYTIYVPVYKTKQEVLASVKNTSVQTINSAGKIFIYGKYIFLNEINKGVHIIDNSNPSSPKAVSFINIPGNLDIAVKGNTLYADMYADLLTIDITDPQHTRLLNTVPRLFPERFYGLNFTPDTSRIIVDWTRKDTTIDISADPGFSPCFNCLFASSSMALADKAGSTAPGIAGSMARFSIVNEYMYTVGQSDLTILSLVNAGKPAIVGTQPVGMNIETIYPFKDKLFIGSSAGMFIYNITNAATPVRESAFTHARACDPVVADDDYAYITLRTGTMCGGSTNVLDIVDVANVASPRLVKSYPLKNPHGLAKDGNLLFVCDGSDGLKLYDASNIGELSLLDHVKDIETYDVIAWNNLLLVVSKTGLQQYDYSDGKKMKLLSTIQIGKKS